jgi:hypothetical protein
MKLEMLKNAFKPDGSRSPTMLRKGTVVDVADEHAESLIDRGYAVEFKSKNADKPDESWTLPELKKYAADHEIDVSAAKNKGDVLAAIVAATTPAA